MLAPEPSLHARLVSDYRHTAEQLIRVARGLAAYYRLKRRGSKSAYAVEWGGACLTAAQGHAVMNDLAKQIQSMRGDHPWLAEHVGTIRIPRLRSHSRRPYRLPERLVHPEPVTTHQQAEIHRLWLKGYGPNGISSAVNLPPKIVASYLPGH